MEDIIMNKCKPENPKSSRDSKSREFPYESYYHNFSLKQLLEKIDSISITQKENYGLIYYYVISTLELEPNTQNVVQRGSGPNLDGGIISLCTCKHWMRTFSDVKNSASLWIAGFTSVNRIPNKHDNYLWYLMKVKSKFRSHYEAWKNLSEDTKKMKNSSKNRFGDLYQPIDNYFKENHELEFDPTCYLPPIEKHPHLEFDSSNSKYEWYYDIEQCYKNSKPYVLLFGDPKLSFVWTKPTIRIKVDNFLEEITEKQERIEYRENIKKKNDVKSIGRGQSKKDFKDWLSILIEDR